MGPRNGRHFWTARILLALAIIAVPLLAACSSGSEYCDQLEATESAWQALRDVNVVTDGTAAFKESFDAFATQVQSLADAARDEFGDDVDAVEASLQQMRDVVSSLDDLGVAAAAEQIGPALTSLQTSTETLLSDVTNACG